MANIEDGAADHLGRHRPDALGDNHLLAVRDIGFAPAIEPTFGLDAAEQQILRAAGAEDKAFDPGYLHVVVSGDDLEVGSR